MIEFVFAAALATADAGRPQAYTPWRMGDWTTCRDGTQVYQYPFEDPAELLCAGHGGVRAHGPGKRLNE